ncbi:PadR family transcriptional regulator [Aeromicrobium sp. 50.2.37]|uniref:PadR family transcriptional regulator n=1 Tax=Aeromicrobium sp. 50.2.37 TaxID=2969305 RepID=UPI00214F685C|nr:PadR family transcriptional regulator [Aeromicrobium sp. 50.2.37]MCR4512824.1 PadR family transcriptional regulator [Aeromicrobium sp. 50.2.37]
MALSHVLLGILADGPAHGYDVKRAHDARFPAAKPLAYGQVYAALGKLADDGGVEVVETPDASGGPERTTYALTDAGRERLRAWLEAVEPPAPTAADDVVRKTITALHAGGDAVEYLRRQRDAHLEAMRRLVRERDATTDVAARVSVDHAVAHLDADLQWLHAAADRFARTSTAGETR